MIRRSATLSLAFLAPFSWAAPPGAPSGGELFVGGGGATQLARVVAGAQQGVVGPLAEIGEPRGLAFGPDGRLYVACFGFDTIVVLDVAAGAVVDVWTDAGLDGPSALAFSPTGDLYVASRETNRVLRFDTAGQKLATLGADSSLDTPSGLAVARNGNLFVTSEQNNAIFEFDANGKFLRAGTIGCGSFLGLFGLAFGWDDMLFTCCRDDHAVKVVGPDLSIVSTIGVAALAQPTALAFGPDDRLYVADASGEIVVFDRDGVETGSIVAASVPSPRALAFAPTRFKASIVTTLIRDGIGREKVKEKYSNSLAAGPLLSIAPGGRAVALTLVDDPNDDDDLASLLGATTLMLPAVDALDPEAAKSRAITAAAQLGASSDSPVATIALTISGKGAFFAPKSASGTLTVAGRGFTLFGTVETTGKE